MTYIQKIEEFIQSNLKNINIVDEIHQCFDLNDFNQTGVTLKSNENAEELYNEYYKFRKELQLKINMYKRNSLYRECEVQRLRDNQMDAITNFNMKDLIWNYFQSFVKLSIFEKRLLKTLIPAHCYYCDNVLDIDDYHCSICSTSIEEMSQFVKRSKNSQNTDEIKYDEINLERDSLVQLTKVNHNCTGYGESKIHMEDNKHVSAFSSTAVDSKMNTGRDCNYRTHQDDKNRNSYNILSKGANMRVLNASDGRGCEKCELVTRILFDELPVCEAKKLDKYQHKLSKNHEKCLYLQNIKVDKVKQKSIPTTWACWNTNCKKQDNKENDTYCSTCKLQREAPQSISDTVKCYLGGTPHDVWFCQKCAKKNTPNDFICTGKNCRSLRFYVNPASDGTVTTPVIDMQYLNHYGPDKSTELIPDRNGDRWPCTKCTFMNEKELSKCKVCSNPKNEDHNKKAKNAKVDNPDTWQCWYHNCRQMNASEQMFCQSCHLSRYAVRDRGSAVEYQYKEVQKLIWICPTCNTFNDLGNTLCKKRFCAAKRFEKEKK